MKIALIACSKTKSPTPIHAANLYTSPLFLKAKAYVQPKYLHWYILSARWGVLHPSQWVEPYDHTLNSLHPSILKEWSTIVAEDILAKRPTQVDFYAGENYRKYVIPILESHGIICTVPLKGKGIGQQLQFYKENQT